MNALGRHLLLELFDCDSDAITNLESVKGALVEAAKRAQATIVDVVSATSTAGSTCANLTRSMAAIAAGPATSGTNT